MGAQEIRSINVFSAFKLFFGISLIVGLVVILLAGLDLIPARMPSSILYWRTRFLDLDTVPKVVLGSFIIGACGGLLATIVALIYNIFSTVMGGVKINIE